MRYLFKQKSKYDKRVNLITLIFGGACSLFGLIYFGAGYLFEFLDNLADYPSNDSPALIWGTTMPYLIGVGILFLLFAFLNHLINKDIIKIPIISLLSVMAICWVIWYFQFAVEFTEHSWNDEEIPDFIRSAGNAFNLILETIFILVCIVPSVLVAIQIFKKLKTAANKT